LRAKIRFGRQTGELLLADDQVCGHFTGPTSADEASAEALARSAVAHPTEAPPIHRACTPDDRVAILIDLEIPQLASVLAPLLEAFVMEAGISAGRIALIHAADAPRNAVDTLIEDLPDSLADVEIIEHNPDDERGHSYLASTASGRRVYLNRLVVDADFVVSVARAGFDPVTGYRGPSSLLYPRMSNAEATRRSRQIALQEGGSPESLYRRQECDEVAQLAGLFYGLCVALNAEGGIARVWLGRFDAVQMEADRFQNERWSVENANDESDLVIAVCARGSSPTDWAGVGQALESALPMLGGRRGRLAVVSDLNEPPGQAGRLLGEMVGDVSALHELRQSDAPDAVTALQCAHALASTQVYLLSQLEDDVVDGLGMTPVASLHEVENLARTSGRIFLLENANLVHVRNRRRLWGASAGPRRKPFDEVD
jgi:hypothetical protein